MKEFSPFSDPLPLDGRDGLAKFSHHLEEKMRVRVTDNRTGAVHHGRISHIGSNHRIHVQVDGAGRDGLVDCLPEEVMPEGFPSGEQPTPTPEPRADVGNSSEDIKLAGFLSSASGLIKAMREGEVPLIELQVVQAALARVGKGQRAYADTFGESENGDLQTLRRIAQKYTTVENSTISPY